MISALLLSLLGYDLVAVHPRLDQVRAMLAAAPSQDANPPPLIREMIDAANGSPDVYATSLVVARVYPKSSSIRRHLRTALWRLLLPMHMGESRMYGLYATLVFNGVDHGLSPFAWREYGKPLDALTPDQTATTVALTFAPTALLNDRVRLDARAQALLKEAGR